MTSFAASVRLIPEVTVAVAEREHLILKVVVVIAKEPQEGRGLFELVQNLFPLVLFEILDLLSPLSLVLMF